ncbi:hypothetical protein Esti_004454 [Eimeria stiedai]
MCFFAFFLTADDHHLELLNYSSSLFLSFFCHQVASLLIPCFFQVRRDAFEFRRDVIVGSENQTTGATLGEGLLRWLEQRVKKRSVQEEKLTRKLREIKRKEAKKRQAAAEEDAYGGLADVQSIDIHQLQIENEQFAQKVEQSKADIAAKKRKCSIKLQTQAMVKKELQRCIEEGERLVAALNSRKLALEKIKKEVEQVAKKDKKLKITLVKSAEWIAAAASAAAASFAAAIAAVATIASTAAIAANGTIAAVANAAAAICAAAVAAAPVDL